jgi:hypothetical protein
MISDNNNNNNKSWGLFIATLFATVVAALPHFRRLKNQKNSTVMMQKPHPNKNENTQQSHHNQDTLCSLQGIPTDVISIVDISSRRKRFGLSEMKWSAPVGVRVPWELSCFASDGNSIFVFGRETNDDSDLSIYEWDEKTAEVSCVSQSFTRIFSHQCRGSKWDITVGVGRVFIIQRSETPGIYQINCFNNRGFLETSFEIKESYEKAWNVNIRVYNGFLWVCQRHLRNLVHQTEKTDKSFLRKFSIDGKLLSTFIISGNVKIYCIDPQEYIYTCGWGSGSIHKYKLDECGGGDGGQDHITENPIEIITLNIRYIFQICCDPIWGSLIALANWDFAKDNYDNNYFIYEISKKNCEIPLKFQNPLQSQNHEIYNIRKICNVHDLCKKNDVGAPASGITITDSSLIAMASRRILRMK